MLTYLLCLKLSDFHNLFRCEHDELFPVADGCGMLVGVIIMVDGRHRAKHRTHKYTRIHDPLPQWQIPEPSTTCPVQKYIAHKSKYNVSIKIKLGSNNKEAHWS